MYFNANKSMEDTVQLKWRWIHKQSIEKYE